jgi:hypothetical protein
MPAGLELWLFRLFRLRALPQGLKPGLIRLTFRPGMNPRPTA